MSKRILAFICMLALLVGLLPVGAIAQTEENTPDTYLVGYAKTNINPPQYGDSILPVYLTGNGNDATRACTGIMNDNGDKDDKGNDVINERDGLFTTCTAVTDAKGTTVLYITLDTLQGETDAVSAIRNKIAKELVVNEDEPPIAGSQIIISGSHTHSAPNLLSLKNSDRKNSEGNPDTALNEAIKAYYDDILKKILDTAQAAYDDRAEAIMKRGSIDAKEATADMGKNDGLGYQMNFLRHFQTTATNNQTKNTVEYVTGASFSPSTGTPVLHNQENYTIGTRTHVAEADDTMHLLQFEFADSSKKPIVFVNWRAHPTTNSGTDDGGNPTKVSSDYVGALRSNLEDSNYRVAFFQGAGANTVISSTIDANAWNMHETKNTVTYGKLLADVAQRCLSNNMTEMSYGDIRIIQRTFTGSIQDDGEGLQSVADSITDASGNITQTTFPYTAKYKDVEYTINSAFHAEQINARKKHVTNNNLDFVTQEIAVVSLGNSAVFVTAPNELSERYGIKYGPNSDAGNDDINRGLWENLTGENYGTPFVLTHTNGMKGYLPNTQNFDYNKDYQDVTVLGVGSYEANTCHFASGTGEALINTYDEMLAELESENTKTCTFCKTEVVWKPVTYLQYKDDYLGSGHYYLAEDIPGNVRKTVRAGETLCLDLNGKNITTNGRSFKIEAEGTLNIFDEAGTGSVTSTYNSNSPQNGTLLIQGNVNIYGGTCKFDNCVSGEKGVNRGGVVGIESGGTLRMYGGTILGNDKMITEGASSDPGAGAAIYVSNGSVYLHNAKVTSGTIPENSIGPCIALHNNAACKVFLSGSTSVDDIYFRPNNKSNLTISDTFTGNVGLSYASDITLSPPVVIGTVAEGADISGATFNLPETLSGCGVFNNNGSLTVLDAIAGVGGIAYESLQAAVTASSENAVIKLFKADADGAIIDKNVYLDLNGHNVTGDVAVNTGCTLYCFDSQTDDYTIEDEAGYGKLKNVSGEGEVKGIPVESNLAEDGYLKITEDDGVSFHRVNLQLTAISLRAVEKGVCAPSVYYKSNFKGDQKVKAAVESNDCGYGIALSVQGMPDADNLDSKCEASRYTEFTSGSAGNEANGTLLYGIMKPTNKDLINYRNANMKFYGRAYIKTADGYMFGSGYERTLKQVTEGADAIWNSLDGGQKDSMIQMYTTYSSVMKSWNLPNLKDIAKNDDALKVLVIGNSHGLDATNLLYEVFEDQGYDEQNLVLGALYKAGCTMKEHADFMTNSTAAYDYYENDGSNTDGSWTVTEDTVADTALNAHQWDIIILQQMNNHAGTDVGYQKTQFTTVINYVKDHQVSAPRFGWHMVWTNPDQDEYLTDESTLSHPDNESWVNYHVKNFSNANDSTKYDQSVMYQRVVECAQTYIEGDQTFLGSDVFDFVIPSCTAIEYAQDELGYEQAQVYRDYTHMSDYGRLMVAYLWYAKIMDLDSISSVGISEIPAVLHNDKSAYPSDLQITPEMQNSIKTSVNYAIEHPYELP